MCQVLPFEELEVDQWIRQRILYWKNFHSGGYTHQRKASPKTEIVWMCLTNPIPLSPHNPGVQPLGVFKNVYKHLIHCWVLLGLVSCFIYSLQHAFPLNVGFLRFLLIGARGCGSFTLMLLCHVCFAVLLSQSTQYLPHHLRCVSVLCRHTRGQEEGLQEGKILLLWFTPFNSYRTVWVFHFFLCQYW